MTKYHLAYPETLRGTVTLPSSKSISARALVIGALAGDTALENLSDCDDTRVLQQALDSRLPEVDIRAAGTAMRFSTAYFSTCEGEVHRITGTARMCQRPIGVLVDALRRLGADIEYVGEEGYPPLLVRGTSLAGGEVELPADVSSQYISALLMIGPTLREGLRLRLVGEVVSRPYIDMTLGMMRRFGAVARWVSEQELQVEPQPYVRGLHFRVEPDWSAASYWYEMMALTGDAGARLLLPALQEESWQGDRVVAPWFEKLGVHTEFTAEGAVLTPSARPTDGQIFEADFTYCPDLAQTFVVTCSLLGQPFRFTGLQSLRIKETDRIAALSAELRRLGIVLHSESSVTDGRSTEILRCLSPLFRSDGRDTAIHTYEDHRMAMSFAPAAMVCPQLAIAHPEVVSKSYPNFWQDLRHLGVSISEAPDNPAGEGPEVQG